jgi:hypothetical protein
MEWTRLVEENRLATNIFGFGAGSLYNGLDAIKRATEKPFDVLISVQLALARQGAKERESSDDG